MNVAPKSRYFKSLEYLFFELLRILTLAKAVTAIIELMPRLITTALKKPIQYSPSEIENKNTVIVPGQGMSPAAMTNATSVEFCVLQLAQLHEAIF